MLKRFFVLLITASLLLFALSLGAVAEDEDPLVSLSYIEQVLKPQLIEEITQEVKSELLKELSGSFVQSESPYSDIEADCGTLICIPKGSEVTLRSGEAVIISESMLDGYGIYDLAADTELFSGDRLVPYHTGAACTDVYLIITRDAYLTVRGDYEIN